MREGRHENAARSGPRIAHAYFVTATAAEKAKVAQRLAEQLFQMKRLLNRPGFGAGPSSIGAEVEVSLVGADARPTPINSEILADSLDPRMVVELDRFNLEFNLTPVQLEGQPFDGLTRELTDALTSMSNAAAAHDARVAPVGILPTLTLDDVQASAMSDVARYHELSAALRQQRKGPFKVRIDGHQPLEVTCDDVTLEGAATSFQVHLRVESRLYADVYNAVQLATPVVLAVAGNSPTFLGHCLWEETRIALFKQAVDGRSEANGLSFPPPRAWFGSGWLREGAFELFAENVALFSPLLHTLFEEEVINGASPALRELRLHNSTVWRWNRPVYDPEFGGHLRIELRALPTGPTIADMVANAAFLIGLSLGLSTRIRDLLPGLPFELARRNFYRAAESGLEAELLWPDSPPSPKAKKASELALSLLPVAREGLTIAGVEEPEIDQNLGLIEARIHSGQTGSVWQRGALEAYSAKHDRDEALRLLVERYLDGVRSGQPVHEWSRP